MRPLSVRARSFLPNPPPDPPHFPRRRALSPQSAPVPPAKRCCCFESEMAREPPRPAQLHHPSTRSPREAASRIPTPPPPPAPPAPVPHTPVASRASGVSAPPQPRFPAAQYFARLAPRVRIERRRPRAACVRSSQSRPHRGELQLPS